MNAIRLPSCDQVGLESRSTLGLMNVTVRFLTSKTPMKLWSARSLTNASFEPSGDQRGLLLVPAAQTSGFSPLSTGVGAGPRVMAYP